MEKKEILIDGYFYDVTDFIKKHPGGSIIEFYTRAGEDSTHAVQQFHQRSIKRVQAMMTGFKRRPAMDDEIELDPAVLKKNRALTEDFTKLYLELDLEGFFKPSHTRNVLRVLDVLAIGYVGYLLLQWPNISAKITGLLLIGLSQGRSAWIQHECGHFSFTGNPKFDRIIQYVIAGAYIGVSATWWRRGHNSHHAMPQRLNHDIDLNTFPLMAYNAKVVKNSKDGMGFMIQHQAILFPVVSTLLGGLFWRWYSVPKFVIKRRLYSEIVAILAHYAFYSQIGFWSWLLSSWLSAIYLFLNFSLSHSYLPVTTEPTHWVEYSFLHTADVEQRPWCDYWMGFLNYQIEHHLFPTMPQFRQPLIKDRVRALAKKHNLPYIVYSYPEAVRKTFENLRNVSKELKIGT